MNIPQLSENMGKTIIGNNYCHKPTGITGYSIQDVKDKVIKHYAEKINSLVNFHEVKRNDPLIQQLRESEIF